MEDERPLVQYAHQLSQIYHSCDGLDVRLVTLKLLHVLLMGSLIDDETEARRAIQESRMPQIFTDLLSHFNTFMIEHLLEIKDMRKVKFAGQAAEDLLKIYVAMVDTRSEVWYAIENATQINMPG